jgi:murein L,D-transpeptidase YafK
MSLFSRSMAPTSRFVGALSLLSVPLTAFLCFGSIELAFGNNHPNNKVQFVNNAKPGPNPDLLLIETYKYLANNELDKAQTTVDELLLAYPNFHLAYLIRGDLISMRTRPVTRFGAANNAPNDRLKDLHEEAIARLKAITERPNKELIPSVLLQMSDEQRYSLVMDAKRARLYLYENIGGIPTLISDYYVSQGKLGMDKFKEGDQRTPLGVYYITNRLPGAKLPDFYGPGALPINYPNEWDKLNGRGGSGIWLHGVPSTNYSRAPLASDGCIVLSNPDFLKIAATVDITKTPVIITEKINFIARANWQTEKLNARKLVDTWLQTVASSTPTNALQLYSKNFRNIANEPTPTWLTKQALLSNKPIGSVKLRELSQFKYPGRDEIIVSNFIVDTQTNKGVSSSKRRQYWAKEGNLWRIIFEDTNLIAGPRVDAESFKELAQITPKEVLTPPANVKVIPPASLDKKTAVSDQLTKSKSEKSNQVQAEIAQTVNRWLTVWSEKNTKAYLEHYAKDFQTPNGEPRKSWMEERRSRIEGKGKITVRIDKPTIVVDGNTATVKFRQSYQSGALSASSRKTLTMVKQDGKWLIKQERTGS